MADPTAPTFSLTITGTNPDEATTAEALEAAVQGMVDQIYGDYTGAKIKVLYEDQTDANAFTDDEKNKLDALNDQATTTAALNGKADASATAAALNGKADASAMTAALLLKADASTVDAALADKADSSTVSAALDDKADAADLNQTKSFYVWSTINVSEIKVDNEGYWIQRDTFEVFTTKYAGREVKINDAGRSDGYGSPFYTLSTGTNYTSDPSIAAVVSGEIHHQHAIGQSLAQGTVDTVYSTTALHEGVALMLSAGVMPVNALSSGFVDLVAGNGFEPPILSAVNYQVGALEAALGSSPKMVATVSAFGGKTYYELMRGSSRWLESVRLFGEVNYFARLDGLAPVLTVLHIHEGEADAAKNASVEQTVAHIMRWRQDHQYLAESVYGQSRQCVAVLHCTSASYYSGSLRMTPWQAACQEAARRAPHLFTVACPTYGLELIAEGETNEYHPTVTGNRRLGEMMGRAALASYYGTSFQPTQVIGHKWLSSTSIRLDCHVPYGGDIEVDTDFDIVSDVGASKGFTVETPSGDIAVSSVSTSGQSITLTLASAASQGATRVGYAVESGSGAYSGDNSNGARGNLRGSSWHSLTDSAITSNDWLLPFTLDI